MIDSIKVPKLNKINVPIPYDDQHVFVFQDIQDNKVKYRKFDGSFVQFQEYDNPPIQCILESGEIIDFQNQDNFRLKY